jgi:hypothetical protein
LPVKDIGLPSHDAGNSDDGSARPNAQHLAAATVDRNLQFVRYLVDPRKAEGRRVLFTIAAAGDPQISQLQLRNGVLVISPVTVASQNHVVLSRQELADFVLSKAVPATGGASLAELDRALDRSRLMPPATSALAVIDAKGSAHHNYGLEN